MPNERQRQLMQEALDAALDQETYQELVTQLDEDEQGKADFSRLKQVDTLLKTAPHERAPQRLALSIMARLAEAVQKPQLSRVSGLALALGLSMVVLVMMPLLVAAVSLFLNAIGSAAVLNTVIQEIANLMTVMVAALQAMVNAAQGLVATYPQAPLLLLALIPVALTWLVRYVYNRRKGGE
jgi:hypothetical protein